MQVKSLFAAVAIAVLALPSFAQEATPDTWRDVQLSKSRAEVQAELAQARADGSIKFSSAGYIEKIAAPKTRTEVRNQAELARASGELAAINGEVYAFDAPATVRTAQAGR